MPLCEVCYSESLEGERYCSQCASVLHEAAVQEEQPVTPPAIPLPLPSAPVSNRATDNSIFSRLQARWGTLDIVQKVALGFVVCLAIFLAVVLPIALSRAPSGNSDYSSTYGETAQRKDSTPPRSLPAIPLNRTPAERLARAKTYLADPQLQYDLDQAKSELQLIPPGTDQYQEARTLLAKIAAGKVRLPSEFERQYAKAILAIQQINPGLTYGKLKKNADRFVGQTWAFTGKVLEIHEQGATTTARIGVGSYGLDAVYIECSCTTDLVEDNAVFVVGTVQGNYTYETVAGWTLTIPHLHALAIVTSSEGAKLRAAAHRR